MPIPSSPDGTVRPLLITAPALQGKGGSARHAGGTLSLGDAATAQGADVSRAAQNAAAIRTAARPAAAIAHDPIGRAPVTVSDGPTDDDDDAQRHEEGSSRRLEGASAAVPATTTAGGVLGVVRRPRVVIGVHAISVGLGAITPAP